MQITKINMKKLDINIKPNLLAVASVELDGCLVIHDLKLVQGKERRLVKFPSKIKEYIKLSDNKDEYERSTGSKDIVHPCTKDFREYIENTLFEIYDGKVLNKEENGNV